MKTAVVLLSLLALALPASGQAPIRTEELIYSILAFNGKDYSGTFARQGSDAIYLVAGVDNFITARKAFVYWWPLTQEWKVDTSVLDEEVQGKIEIDGPGMPRHDLAKASYTYYNVKGEYELNWRVAKGDEAKRIYAYYQKQQDADWKARDAYMDAQLAHEKLTNELTERILTMRKKGLDPAALVKQLQSLKAPEEPKPSDEFVVPPREPQEAYNINLPVGLYHIHLVTPDGHVMEGSERKLVLFQKRRSGTAGYDVIPADKWTRPEESSQPGSVLYVNGMTDIFLRPFYQDEFNDLDYEKLIRNDARGNPNLTKWVKMQQVPKATIEVTRGAEVEKTTEKPYRVEQLPGSALGYKIIPFEPKPDQTQADLYAYKVAISRDRGVLRLDTRDSSGALLKGSQRQIRIVPQAQGLGPLLILALVPLLVMGLVIAFRATRLNQ
jgi:hypothetical protein